MGNIHFLFKQKPYVSCDYAKLQCKLEIHLSKIELMYVNFFSISPVLRMGLYKKTN